MKKIETSPFYSPFYFTSSIPRNLFYTFGIKEFVKLP